MEAPATESPFKKDEPVSGSRFWIFLTGLCAAVWAVMAVWHWGRAVQDEYDFLMLATAVGLLGTLAVFLFQSAFAAGQCRAQRSFEIMAAAVRPQRRVWGILAIMGAAGAVCFTLWALRHRPINIYIRTMMQKHSQAPPARQVPQAPQIPQATPAPPANNQSTQQP